MSGYERAAVGATRHIHQREVDWLAVRIACTRPGTRQRFHRCFPARAVAFQKENDQPPGRGVLIVRLLLPAIIANNERVAIFLWKLVVFVKHAPDRKSTRLNSS